MIHESHRCTLAGGPFEGRQLAFYDFRDPAWLTVLFEHLAKGGCIVIERTGTLLIMPGPDPKT